MQGVGQLSLHRDDMVAGPVGRLEIFVWCLVPVSHLVEFHSGPGFGVY
jgi:hypothetical protein